MQMLLLPLLASATLCLLVHEVFPAASNASFKLGSDGGRAVFDFGDEKDWDVMFGNISVREMQVWGVGVILS